MKRIVRTAAWGVLLSVAFSAAPAAGDCGSIPFERGVQVFEPIQRALIAWDGREEILILSTDLHASKPTKVLEVISLPAKPTVRKGNVQVFPDAIKLINEKLRKQAAQRPRASTLGTFGDAAEGGGAELPAGEVTLHTTIGATDISVTRVLKPQGFVDWVENCLKSLKVEGPEIPDPLKEVVGEYLADGCTWFVFNVVSLDDRVKTKQAIEYRFESDCIYYPLRITRTETGDTSIELLILTRELINAHTFTGFPRSKVDLSHTPVDISSKELIRLHVGIYDFLRRPPTAKLRIWTMSGKLSGFTEDLLAGRPHRFRLKCERTGKIYGPFTLLNDVRVNIDGELFLVDPGDQRDPNPERLFQLRSFRFDRPYGPFKLVDGEKVTLGKRVFRLLWRRPAVAEVAQAAGG